jgi:hypothetical protein
MTPPTLTDDSMDDPDSDGLPNLAEYVLHTDPQTADNPLNLLDLSMTSGYLDVPLTISPEVAPSTTFLVSVDGAAVAVGAGINVVQTSDRTWHLQLNPIFANGSHVLNLGFQYSADFASSWQTAFGSPGTLVVNDPFTLDSTSATYDGSLDIEASVNVSATGYFIEVYDIHNHLLKTLTGPIVGGRISASWDLNDADGNLVAFGPLRCAFNLSSCSASGTAIILPKDCKCGKDVTKLVYATLKDIAKVYNNASWFKQRLAQIEIRAAQPWDMQYLAKSLDQDVIEENLHCPLCRRTVTFEGQCVSADELNYMLLGEAFVLSSEKPFNPVQMLAQFDILLMNRINAETGEPDPEDVRLRKLGFAAYVISIRGLGPKHPDHYYFPVKLDDLKWPYGCSVNKRPALRDRFISPAYPENWYWNGLRTSFEIPGFPPYP